MITNFSEGNGGGFPAARLASARVKALVVVLAFALVWLGAGAAEGLAAPNDQSATAVAAAKAKKKAAKKKSCKKGQTLKKGKCVKKCKKTHTLKKGKCVKKKATSPTKPKPQQPTGPNPLSDADGDGLPYKWEVKPPAKPKPSNPAKPKSCKKGQALKKGKCVKKCKKGRTLKKGKCVKKKKKASKGKGSKPKAKKSALEPANLASLGASPNHKDIFVQIDYTNEGLSQNVSCSELDAITAAFANAPVSNPDGKSGIALHIDAGVTCPSRSYDFGGSRVFDAGPCPGTSAVFNYLAANMPESRIGTFHFAGFSPTACGGGGEGGAADPAGTKMVVYTDGPSFAHVLMHELGHNLGLDHPFPGQPNRISTMNTRLFASDNGSGSTEVLDFQRFPLPALDENNLSEENGIGAPAAAHRFYITHYCADAVPAGYRNAWPGDGPIDWNCNSPAIIVPPNGLTIDPGPVSADVNGDGQKSVFPATSAEWGTLSYRSGGKIGLP